MFLFVLLFKLFVFLVVFRLLFLGFSWLLMLKRGELLLVNFLLRKLLVFSFFLFLELLLKVMMFCGLVMFLLFVKLE